MEHAIKHDLNRIYKISGKGSYQDVVRNIPLWLSQFPQAATKVTISSADIPYIKESVLHLYSLGIHEVNINCVFEDVWRDGDDLLFEDQLTLLADAIIEKGYYKDYACSFFSEYLGNPLDCVLQNQNWCGAGKMLAIDAAGNFYPCTRFAQYSLRNKKAWIIGNVYDGIDPNKLRPFLTLDRCTQSTQECIDCEVAGGCAWCQGENYDAAETLLSTNVAQPYVRCIKREYVQIIIIGISFTINYDKHAPILDCIIRRYKCFVLSLFKRKDRKKTDCIE